METIAELAAAARALRDEVRAGHPDAHFHITIEGGGGNGGKRFCGFLRLDGWTSTSESIIRWGATADEAMGLIREAVAALPHVWTAEDVAATVGIVYAPEQPQRRSGHDRRVRRAPGKAASSVGPATFDHPVHGEQLDDRKIERRQQPQTAEAA